MSEETAVTPTASGTDPASRGYAMTGLEGLGLFYGETGTGGKRRIFSQAEWESICAQAVAWGIAILHPKVADGLNWWYSPAEMQILASIAKAHHLKCYPYHYSWGNTEGSNVAGEAHITVQIGQIFGGVCPDMEIQWEKAGATAVSWAAEYGKIVRAQFTGPVIPTLFGNPSQHAGFPYKELLSWVSGWMPMAYYDEWTDSAGKMFTAAEAIDYLYPEWLTLSQGLVNEHLFPPPILPLIELGRGIPSTQVVAWLERMAAYGYCGFWYDGTYPPYSSAIKSAPRPAWRLPVTTPPPVPPVVTPPVKPPVTTPPVVIPPPAGVILPTISGMQQNLSLEELEASWLVGTNGKISPFTPQSPFCAFWAVLLQNGYGIGSPMQESDTMIVNGKTYSLLECEGGRIFLDQNTTPAHTWVQLISSVRFPGTPITTPGV